MNIKALIKKINKELPEARATEGIEWDENADTAKDGHLIWFRGSEDYAADDELIYDNYGHINTAGVHPKLNKIVEAAGWYCEPYDAGTLFAIKE
jgi:hypothetical protein